MKKLFLYCLTLLLLSCCIGNRGNDDVVLGNEGIVSVLDLIDSMQVVQLETNEQCFINTVRKVLFYKGIYYLFDQRQQAVLCFDQCGTFVRKISDRGRGPQEYEFLGDIAIDTYNEQILLAIPFGSVLVFDMDGNFISRVNIPEVGAINELHVLDSDRWLVVSLNTHQILYFSKKENRIVERLFERDVLVSPIFPLNRAYAYNDSIFFAPIFSNETLNMKNQEKRVAYSWNFGVMNNRQGKVESFISELKILESRPYVPGENKYEECLALINHYLNYLIRFTRETSRYRMAVLDYKNDLEHILYDKQEQKAIVFRETQEGIRWTNPYFMCNQDMVIAFDVEEPPYASYTSEILSPKQRQVVEAFNPETDNPFLVIYHLKK